ncbi:MAG: cache domain-containing protein [Bacteroidales bacterium]|nr:cache domain-containing protein [Bacteroidales bacterium]
MIPENGFRKFFLSIILPSIIAISLFIGSIYLVLIPAFEKNSMDRKKEIIRELTHTAWSLINEYNQEYKDSLLTLEQAKASAIHRVSKMRYGNEAKDYFWIIDQQPSMIMHPYRNTMIGVDLTNYVDPEGTHLFVEAVELVNQQAEGYIHYLWQWKDDSTRIVPKLSYVKAFDEWGWILGTGIYLEDVKIEIRNLKKRVLVISSIIILIIIIVLLYIINQSLNIERKRSSTEDKLRHSKQKYKALVEASTDGTLLMVNEKLRFCNLKFAQLLQKTSMQILSMHFDDLFEISWNEIQNRFDDPDKSISIETKVKLNEFETYDVVISVSKVKYADEDGFIIITKEITNLKRIEIEGEHLTDELKHSLSLMNQSIKSLVKEFIHCELSTPVVQAATLMARKKQKVIFVSHQGKIVGVVNESDFCNRFLVKGLEPDTQIAQIMSSPVIRISDHALLYEAKLIINNEHISHLVVTNAEGQMYGVLSNTDILEIQQNSLSVFIKEIALTDDVQQLKLIYQRIPVLLKALFDSGIKASNITRLISKVADEICRKIINLALQEMAEPPCSFAFIALGSEGRREQTLNTDQDNAIIIEDSEIGRQDDSRAFFRELGNKVNANLGIVGYKLCKGEVMARNPKWVQSLDVWNTYFDAWLHTPEPQAVLDASIFFDFRCIYGDDKLVDDLRTHLNSQIENKSLFLHHLAQTVFKFKPPLSVFGGIKTDHSSFDIKKVMVPIISFIRLYALKNNIDEANTLERLKLLRVKGCISTTVYNELEVSYNYLMLKRLQFQLREIENDQTVDNLVEVEQLSEVEITTIKKIFSEIGKLQLTLSNDFNISP